MQIKTRPRLDTKQVAEARALGLDISRIVEEALIREMAAERIRRQTGQAKNREGGEDPGYHEPDRALTGTCPYLG
jgi:post-segregation antitoxin (ccd killing protein)